MTIQVPEAMKRRAICPRCSGKGFVLCPKCQGTGDEWNAFFVAIGPCRYCQPMMRNIMKGFVACPKCEGRCTPEAVHFGQEHRVERSMTESPMYPSIHPANWS